MTKLELLLEAYEAYKAECLVQEAPLQAEVKRLHKEYMILNHYHPDSREVESKCKELELAREQLSLFLDKVWHEERWF